MPWIQAGLDVCRRCGYTLCSGVMWNALWARPDVIKLPNTHLLIDKTEAVISMSTEHMTTSQPPDHLLHRGLHLPSSSPTGTSPSSGTTAMTARPTNTSVSDWAHKRVRGREDGVQRESTATVDSWSMPILQQHLEHQPCTTHSSLRFHRLPRKNNGRRSYSWLSLDKRVRIN